MDRLKELLEELDFGGIAILLSFEEGSWYIDDTEIYWNTDRNLEDLYNKGGNTYSGWMREGKGVSGEYLTTTQTYNKLLVSQVFLNCLMK